MKTRKEYIQDAIKSRNLHPIGTKVIIKDPKLADFMEEGVIINHFEKNGSSIWDYSIKLKNNSVVFHDKYVIDLI